jgi:hypothetical protein
MTFWWLWAIGSLGVTIWSIRLSFKTFLQGLTLILIVCLVRWVLTPMEHYEVLGHSTQYLAVFNGEIPMGGDTSAYPLMQIVWWLLGWVSPDFVPSYLWSMLAGAASVVLLGRHQQQWHLGMLCWFALWPLHWLWSFSAYNVIWPFFWLTLANHFLQERRWLGLAAAFSLAISCRVESLIVWPFFWFVAKSTEDSLSWTQLISATVISLIPIVAMLQFPVPGEGEIQLSWGVNWNFVGLYQEFGSAIIAWILLGSILGKSRRYIIACALLGLFHASMIGFNDWSSRHILPLGLIVYWVWHWVKTEQIWGHRLLGGLLLLNNMSALWAERSTFYASTEAFESHFLEVVEDQMASVGECAWVVEEEVFLLDERPVLSHFNLLNPEEVQEYLEVFGCIQWCRTHQDWRWTELDIRDRALRLKHLYDWNFEGWFRANDNACLVYQLESTSMD